MCIFKCIFKCLQSVENIRDVGKPLFAQPQSFCRKHPSTISSLWVVLWKTVSFCRKHVGTKSSHFCQSWDSLLIFCTGSQSKLANLVHISDLQLPNEWWDIVEIACIHFAPAVNQANLVYISCGHKLIVRKNTIKVLVNSNFDDLDQQKWVGNNHVWKILTFCRGFPFKLLPCWFAGYEFVVIVKTFRLMWEIQLHWVVICFEFWSSASIFTFFHFHFLDIFSSKRASKWFMTGSMSDQYFSSSLSREKELDIMVFTF